MPTVEQQVSGDEKISKDDEALGNEKASEEQIDIKSYRYRSRGHNRDRHDGRRSRGDKG